MAMIRCPECNRMISETASNCPKCGHALTIMEVKLEKEKIERTIALNKKAYAFGAAFFAVLIVISTLLTYEKKAREEDNNRNLGSPTIQLPSVDSNENQIDSLTTGQKNALATAQKYLDFTSFSHDGLIEQLEFEGYPTDDATYAADNCGADWNEQAAKSAKKYLSRFSFSRDGLIEQLEYEGYTHSQAVYGVEQNGY